METLINKTTNCVKSCDKALKVDFEIESSPYNRESKLKLKETKIKLKPEKELKLILKKYGRNVYRRIDCC